MLKGSVNQRSLKGEEAQSSEEKRRSLGIYYTPGSAARILANWAIRSHQDVVLEPSFGGCAMLEAAIARLSELGCKLPEAQLYGFDIDQGAFQYLNRLFKQPEAARQFALRDFLKADPSEARLATSVLANPPFVSYHRMTAHQRNAIERWRDLYRAKFPKTASLWAYFVVHALSFLRPKGRIAFVLPLSITTSNYGKPIIEIVARLFERVHLLSVNEQLFIQEGAEERTALLLAENYLWEGKRYPVSEHRASSIHELERAVVQLASPANDPRPLGMPVDPSHTLLKEMQERGDLVALGEIVDVQIGEVVGDTQFFVKPATEWRDMGISDKHLRPLVTRMKQLAGIRIRRRDVSSAYSRIPVLLRPPQRIARSIEEYLNAYPRARRETNVTFAKRDPWYAVSYNTEARAFIGSLAHEGPRIVLNTAEVSCGNGLYKLLPVRGISWRSAVALAVLCTVTQHSAELRARTRGGGAMKLEPSDVKTLYLPSTFRDLPAPKATRLIAVVDNLLRAGDREAAARLVDEVLLVSTGFMTPKELRDLQHSLRQARSERLRRGR